MPNKYFDFNLITQIPSPAPIRLATALVWLMISSITCASDEIELNPQTVPTFDVTTFSAKGDGETDDSAAIQFAIDKAADTGGTAYVPPGRYLTGPIYLRTGAKLSGAGRKSVLLLKANSKDHLLSPADRSIVPSVKDVTITDLTLIGNSALQNNGHSMAGPAGKHGIAILGGEGWLVRNVLVQDFDGDGIYLGRNFNNSANMPARGNLVERCRVTLNIRNGMMISHGEDNVIRNNIFEGNQLGIVPGHAKYDPDVYTSAELDIEPNTYHFSEHATNNLIEMNTFQNGNGVAIQITRPHTQITGNVIRNNTFIDNKGGQILLRSPTAIHNRIIGNNFIATSPSVMPFVLLISNGSYNQVTGNTFLGGVRDGGKFHAITFDTEKLSFRTRLRHLFNNPELSAPILTFHNVFSGNRIDLHGSKREGACIYFDSMTRDSIVENNILLHGTFEIFGTTLVNRKS